MQIYIPLARQLFPQPIRFHAAADKHADDKVQGYIRGHSIPSSTTAAQFATPADVRHFPIPSNSRPPDGALSVSSRVFQRGLSSEEAKEEPLSILPLPIVLKHLIKEYFNHEDPIFRTLSIQQKIETFQRVILQHIQENGNLGLLELYTYRKLIKDLIGIDFEKYMLSVITEINGICTDESLQYITGLINLQTLDLFNCTKVTDQGLLHIAKLKHLRSLDLGCCPSVTNKGIRYITGLKHLEKLSLYRCSQITDEGLQHVARIECLKHLDLTKCSQITDEGLRSIAMLINLQTLSLSHCHRITDEGVQHFATLKRLRRLQVSNCVRITDKEMRPRLERLG